jgi:hypothetical protein
MEIRERYPRFSPEGTNEMSPYLRRDQEVVHGQFLGNSVSVSNSQGAEISNAYGSASFQADTS